MNKKPKIKHLVQAFQPANGVLVLHEDRMARIRGVPDLDHLAVEYLDDGSRRLVLQSEVAAPPNEVARANPVHVDLATVDDSDRLKAEMRFKAIEPLLANENRTRADVAARAAEVGSSVTTLYRWMDQFRCTGTVSDLLPKQVSESRGRTKLPKLVEQIVAAVLKLYPQKFPTIQSAFNKIADRCSRIDLPAPHMATIRNRVHRIHPEEFARRSKGKKAARDDHAPKPNRYGDAIAPLSIIQIDHVLLPLQVVDAALRMAVGRPWLTIAIDIFSRVVWGFFLSLESPRAFSVAMCLAHGMLPKEGWLAQRNINCRWPVYGPPRSLHCDNAKEFRGTALLLGAREFHIDLQWRPVARPEYGAHIERLCGTLQTALMELPGAAPPPDRRNEDTDYEAASCMTLEELEQWLALQIAGRYHQSVHSSLGVTPLEQWQMGLLGTDETPGIGMPERFTDPKAVLLRLLPHTFRTIQQYGIQHMGVTYWDPGLTPFINHKTDSLKGRKFLVRWDPRDISRIFVWIDEMESYLEVPYRNPARPSVTQRELTLARAELRKQGISSSDENEIFRVLEDQRALVQSAAARTKTARKESARREEAKRSLKKSPARKDADTERREFRSPEAEIDYSSIQPFAEDDDA